MWQIEISSLLDSTAFSFRGNGDKDECVEMAIQQFMSKHDLSLFHIMIGEFVISITKKD